MTGYVFTNWTEEPVTQNNGLQANALFTVGESLPYNPEAVTITKDTKYLAHSNIATNSISITAPLPEGCKDLHAEINGATVTEAAYNNTVQVKYAFEPGYKIGPNGIVVVDDLGNPVAVTADGKFNMPATAVTVNIDVAKTDFELNIVDPLPEGAAEEIYLENDRGERITTAQVGDKVKVVYKAKDGYALDKIIVRDSQGNIIPVDENGCFVMPADGVTIEVLFTKLPEPAPVPGGDGDYDSTAKTGDLRSPLALAGLAALFATCAAGITILRRRRKRD